MKKLFILALALVMTLSLCACGSSNSLDTTNNTLAPNADHNPGASEYDNGVSEETIATPTEEEEAMLQDYVKIVNCMNDHLMNGRNLKIEYHGENYKNADARLVMYQALQSMEAIDKWIEKDFLTEKL